MRLSYIDGLKGVGALMVFFTHYRMMELFSPCEAVWKNPVLTFVMSGKIAVQLFLMVSAYSIALSVKNKMSKRTNWGGVKIIIVKRYFRLAIPLAVILVIEGFLYPLGIFNPHDVVESLGARSGVVNAYQSLTYQGLVKAIFLSPIGNHAGWLSPAWMLQYIFFGTFIVIILKIGIYGMTIVGKIIMYSLFTLIFCACSLYYLPIIIGSLLSEFKNEQRIMKGYSSFAFTFLLLSVAFVLHVYLKNDIKNTFIALLILVSVMYAKCIQIVLSSKCFLWLGEMSFGVYLIHWPLICSFTVWEYSYFIGMKGITTMGFVFASTVLILMVSSYIFRELVENRLCPIIMKKVVEVLK